MGLLWIPGGGAGAATGPLVMAPPPPPPLPPPPAPTIPWPWWCPTPTPFMAVTAADAGPAVLEPGGGMGGRGMLNRRQQEEAKVKTDTTVLCAQVKLP